MPNNVNLSSLELTAIIVAIVVLLLFVWFLVRRLRRRGPVYQAVDAVLTPSERAFLPALRDAVESDQVVLAKVRMADVLRPRPELARRRQRAALERISAKRFDFVVCGVVDTSPRFVVELDDLSRGRSDRRERDGQVEAVCADAGLPVLRVPAANKYASEHIREQIAALLAPPESPLPQGPVTPDGRREPLLDLPDDPADPRR